MRDPARTLTCPHAPSSQHMTANHHTHRPMRDHQPARDHEPARDHQPARDHLRAWSEVRSRVPWATAARPVSGPIRGDRDGILDHVRSGDPTRAARTSSALGRIAAAADTGTDLTFPLLTAVQSEILGRPVAGFRTGPAFAKAGREHYALHRDTEAHFIRCLGEATDQAIPLPARAARIYLDVCFFHPFPDGNARAATLCLYHTLRRDGVILDQATPLLHTVRRADDLPGTQDLIRLLEILITATHHRSTAPPHHLHHRKTP